MRTTRRGFIGSCAAIGATKLAPALLEGGGDRVLVAIQVEGGWDYLNMLVPADHWAG